MIGVVTGGDVTGGVVAGGFVTGGVVTFGGEVVRGDVVRGGLVGDGSVTLGACVVSGTDGDSLPVTSVVVVGCDVELDVVVVGGAAGPDPEDAAQTAAMAATTMTIAAIANHLDPCA